MPDFTIATSVFVADRLVGFAGTIAHLSDIGGTLIGADTKEVFEEGLFVPIMRLASAGKINEDLMAILKANVRVPEWVIGDLHAQIAAVEVLAQRLQEMVLEQGADMLTSIAEVTHRLAEAAMRRAIAAIPDGTYRVQIHLSGQHQTIELPNRILLDTKPPYTNAGGQNYFQAGYDPGYVDPRGRTFLLTGTYKFM